MDHPGDVVGGAAQGELRPPARTSLSEVKGLLAVLRNVVFFAAIYLYFVGWCYSYYLFKEFGISLSSVETPFYNFFIYAYPVLTGHCFQSLFGILVLVLCLVFARGNGRTWAVVVLVLAFLPRLRALSEETAKTDSRSIRMGYDAKLVTFSFTNRARGNYPQQFLAANCSGRLTLITQTKDRYYVFYQPLGEGDALPIGFTYDIPKADLRLASIHIP